MRYILFEMLWKRFLYCFIKAHIRSVACNSTVTVRKIRPIGTPYPPIVPYKQPSTAQSSPEIIS